MINNKIVAYQEGWQPYKGTKEDYIQSTTVATEPIEIKSLINEYIKNNVEEIDVENFLFRVVNDDELISKINIVWDGSYRNVVWLVRPDCVDRYNEEELQSFKENAETIFMILDRQPSEERKADWDAMREMFMMDDEYYDEEYCDEF